MAYTRLLRAYYRREKPIAEQEAYRLCRASSRSQKAAVDSVLAEFFTKQDDGWHNKRADEEVTAYQAQADTNRRIAQGRTRQRTVNESSNEPSTNRPPAYTASGAPNQEPLTRTKNQEPEKPNPLPPTAAQAPDPIFGVCLDFLKAKGVEDKSARSVLGLWRKNHGEEVTFATVEAARREDVSEPVAWITKALQAQGKPGKVRHGGFGQQNYRTGVGSDGSF